MFYEINMATGHVSENALSLSLFFLYIHIVFQIAKFLFVFIFFFFNFTFFVLCDQNSDLAGHTSIKKN